MGLHDDGRARFGGAGGWEEKAHDPCNRTRAEASRGRLAPGWPGDRRWGAFSAAAVLLALAPACGDDLPSPATHPRNAVLITLDTTRADALSCLGAPDGVTPHLDRLAAESVVYEQARTVAPLTLPSHASMLTGLYPPRHTVRDNALTPLPLSARTLAESARKRGFTTAAVIAAPVLDASFGLGQGFEVYDQPDLARAREANRHGGRVAEDVEARASRWLRERDTARPFLLWVHFFDPHEAYEPAPEHLSQANGDPYLGEVARMDHAVGELVATLRDVGVWDETMIVVVADHGEGRGEHGEETHAAMVYDTTMRVPLLIRYPDEHRAGERSQEIVSVADVHPTLMDALDLGPAGDVDGTSLFGRRAPDGRGVYFESFYGVFYHGWSPLLGLADASGKYVFSSTPELYDPRDDPGELNNVHTAAAAAPYRERIDAILGRRGLTPGGDQVDRSFIPALQALGYAGAGGSDGDVRDPLAPSSRPSPHARALELRSIRACYALSAAGRYAETAEACADILGGSPDNHAILSLRGSALWRLGRHAEAIEPLMRFTRVGPPWPATYSVLASCLLEVGRLDDSLAWFQQTVSLNPQDREGLRNIVDILVRLGRSDEATPFRERLERLSGR